MTRDAMGAGRGKSSRRSLMIAIVFGVLSAVLVLVYLKNAKGGGGNAGVVTAPAVFATQDINARDKITEGMLEVRQIPVDARHPLAVIEVNRAVNQIARVNIAKGEQVLSTKIADQVRDVGFSASVPEGQRGVAVGVTEVIASGGHIGPGDFVDVIGVFEVFVPKDQNGKATGSNAPKDSFGKDQGDTPKMYSAVTILQNIKVLAVADKSDPTLQTSNDKKVSGSSGRDEAKSVTLAVTPEQAEKLFLAEEIGKLRLSLRPFGDQEARKIEPVVNSLGDLVGP